MVCATKRPKGFSTLSYWADYLHLKCAAFGGERGNDRGHSPRTPSQSKGCRPLHSRCGTLQLKRDSVLAWSMCAIQRMRGYIMATQSITEIYDLKGKAAIVTGGAMGIGEAIALRLAEAGASVM